jgi:hypothetical protein
MAIMCTGSNLTLYVSIEEHVERTIVDILLGDFNRSNGQFADVAIYIHLVVFERSTDMGDIRFLIEL